MSAIDTLLNRKDVFLLNPGELRELPGDFVHGTRPSITAVTWHYAGPAQPGVGDPKQEYALLKSYAEQHSAPNRFGAGLVHDGLAYDAAVLSDRLLILRPPRPREVHWHAGNRDGNWSSTGLVFVLGGEQKPTAVQMELAYRYTDAIIADYNIQGGRRRVFGHNEWAGAATACPGRLLPEYLVPWRTKTPGAVSSVSQASKTLYRVLPTELNELNVRSKPGTYGEILRTAKTGALLNVDWVTRGTTVKLPWGTIESDEWLHLYEGGYVSKLFTQLVPRMFRVAVASGARVRSETNTASATVSLPEYGDTDVLPHGTLVSVDEELAGDAVLPAYPSPLWYRLSGRSVYIKAELLEEVV